MDRNIVTSVFLIMLTCLTWADNLGSSHDASPVLSRSRRDLWSFSSMINCATNRTSLDFNGYGCYCGLGGSGTSVDALDGCCETHDDCYEDLSTNGTCNVYLSPYTYTTQDCLTIFNQNSDNPPQPQIECNADVNTQCLQALCECDRVAAFCFARARYDEDYRGYDKATHCQEQNTELNRSVVPNPQKAPTPTPTVGGAPQKSSSFIKMMFLICAALAYIMN